MRLFTAIDLPQTLSLQLESVLVHLRQLAALRWSSVANLHITTKFLGEVTPERLPEVEAVLRAICVRPFRIRVKDFGWFPNERSPRVLFLRIDAEPELARLAELMNDALSAVGIRKENRAYSPHLTLARVPPACALQQLRERLSPHVFPRWEAFDVDRFFLYRSHTGPQGSVYEKLREFRLGSLCSVAGHC